MYILVTQPFSMILMYVIHVTYTWNILILPICLTSMRFAAAMSPGCEDDAPCKFGCAQLVSIHKPDALSFARSMSRRGSFKHGLTPPQTNMTMENFHF